ncbi:MAG: TonB-dependent hemoglobin/transferrin/lactoferrin family receptor [Acinetobacter populi]|jgi:hemoglobin/transferrin/lactoferrin receptor protein|uniref:TonB-dependent hemoglobin/transferrin/lactoferrin family receptor n=1 Tax=Acinetobacter populi TaxID=1582270 RepID=UPI002356C0D0|nr:TonB-dependent hemoglobin/transferrin/lactoferrin family receptor [Acinetobacter populi]MCH4248598.1 TonB-dependent hemoglobin/transferrin/lactoferrin family receptor [Acinetobacter populi]
MRESLLLRQSLLAVQPNYLALCIAVLLTTPALSYAEDEKSYTTLPVITVYAEKEHNTPASITTINRENLDKTGATDMASIVKYLPLVNAPFSTNGSSTFYAGSGTSSYNIRGIEGNRVGLDVDGVDIADATIAVTTGASMRQTAAGRDYIEPEMFNSVNIESGTTDVSADGIGGRVSFKTKSPDDYLIDGKTIAGTVKSGYSSANNSWFGSVTGAVGNDTVKGLVAYAHRDGHETEPNSKTKAFPMDWDSDAVLTRLLWNINEQNQLGFTFDYYQKQSDVSQMDGTVYSQLTTYENGTQHQDIERKQFALDYIFKPDDFVLFNQLNTKVWHQISNNGTRTGYNMSTGVYRDFSNDYEEKNTGIKLEANKVLGQHNIRYGLTADQKKYSSSRADLRDGSLSSGLYQGAYMSDSKVNRYALYLSDAMNFDVFNKELVITPALRAERQEYKPSNSDSLDVTKKDFSYLSPALSLSYQLTPDNYTYAKYTRGTRVPTATEIGGYFQTTPTAYYYLSGNSNLKKETSDAFEIGLRNTSIDGIKFDISSFYTKYSNFIDYKQFIGSGNCSVGIASQCYVAENIADASIWGGELSTRIDLGKFIAHSDGFSLGLVAGATNGSAKSSDGTKTGINSIQPAKASLTFAYDDPNKVFGLGLTATSVASKTASSDATSYQGSTDVVNYKPVAAYTIFDLSGYWNINKYTKLNVAFNNMFDKTYWSYASVGTLIGSGTDQATLIDRAAEPGRNVVASLEFKF